MYVLIFPRRFFNPCLYYITLLIFFGVKHCLATDMIDNSPSPYRLDEPKTPAVLELRKRTASYEKVTGKPANRNNVLNSLTNNIDLKIVSDEVFWALEFLIAEAEAKKIFDNQKPLVVNHLLLCFARYTNGLIRMECVRALLRIDKSMGYTIANRFINDSKSELYDKLMIIKEIVDEKNLNLYGYCLQGLRFRNKSERMLALEALARFKRYNGLPWNTNGDKIDIAKAEEFIKTMSIKTNAAEIKMNSVK